VKESTVVFIGIQDYDNLGIGYMTSILAKSGIMSKVVDFRKKKQVILRIIKKIDPLLVGFSILFENYINNFIDLAEYLRSEGVSCHFTAGGHYASLKPEELFKNMPQLDSIVRFEGEYTLTELVKCIFSGRDWEKIRNLAYMKNGKMVLNSLRPLEKDLDKFPFPARSPLKTYAFKKKFATIIAGRGCVHNCSFCNTREFYLQASGPIKRIRKPEMVVREMEYLYKKRGCSVFLFQDDDFPVKSKLMPDWIKVFCLELERTGLIKKVIWKIACRPDEIEEETFLLMKINGLFQVFLGIEDGTNAGLRRLNKHMTVEKSLNGINILRKLKIDFDYGFILFQPLTTFKSLNENLDFLRYICSDGYTPATFLRLIPLYETREETELLKAGKLKSSDNLREYDFLQESMNHFYDFIVDCFTEWLRYPDGVENISKWARNYLSVYMKYLDYLPQGINFQRKVRKVIAQSNIFLLDTMYELSEIFREDCDSEDKMLLKSYKNRIKLKHDYFKNEIISIKANLLSYVEDQKIKNYV
jgi:anaerobic magnesium-protoporphyrin IX monomethyl ester cyclase